jgi:site-specific DNA recombinase
MRRKIQEGIFPWKPPLGYKSAVRDGTKKTKPDEPDQPLFGFLQKAWKECATGAFKKADIKRLMGSWGVETRNGIPMTAQSLDNFFRNPYYAGILVDPWSHEEHPGTHVPMVSREDFERVQAILAQRNRSVAHLKERLEFPLRGLARCPSCRQYLTGGFSKGRSKRYAYYHCGNRRCSAHPNYPVQVAHEEFGAFVDQVAPKPEVIQALGGRILKAAEEKQIDSRTRRERKSKELARLDGQIQELIRMRSQQLITDNEFVGLKKKISERRLAIEDVALPERFDAKRVQADLTQILRPLTELRATWNAIPVGFQRRFNHMVVPVGFVIGESRTAELGLLFRALGESDRVNSHEVPLTGENLNRLVQAIQAFAELFGEMREMKKAA